MVENKLRARGDRTKMYAPSGSDCDLMIEAAAEIERMRKALQKIADARITFYSDDARKALEMSASQ